MSPFEVNIEERENFVIMKLSGSSTAVNKQADEVLNLRDTFKQLAKEDKFRIIVDLKDVEYIASDTIGALLSGNSIVKKLDGKLALCNPSDYVNKIFAIVRLSEVLSIFKTLDEAIEYIKK
jgi:anti-anti-sigma factor